MQRNSTVHLPLGADYPKIQVDVDIKFFSGLSFLESSQALADENYQGEQLLETKMTDKLLERSKVFEKKVLSKIITTN